MNLSGVVLLIRVGHEGDGGMQNGCRRQHPLLIRIEGQNGLQAQHREPDHERRSVEQEKSPAVLLPVLRSRIEPAFDARQPCRWVIAPVEDPGHEQAERDRQDDRRDEYQQRKKPHGIQHSFIGSSFVTRTARGE